MRLQLTARQLGNLGPRNSHLTGGGVDQTHNGARHGRFPRPAFAHNPKGPARLDGKVHISRRTDPLAGFEKASPAIGHF